MIYIIAVVLLICVMLFAWQLAQRNTEINDLELKLDHARDDAETCRRHLATSRRAEMDARGQAERYRRLYNNTRNKQYKKATAKKASK